MILKDFENLSEDVIKGVSDPIFGRIKKFVVGDIDGLTKKVNEIGDFFADIPHYVTDEATKKIGRLSAVGLKKMEYIHSIVPIEEISMALAIGNNMVQFVWEKKSIEEVFKAFHAAAKDNMISLHDFQSIFDTVEPTKVIISIGLITQHSITVSEKNVNRLIKYLPDIIYELRKTPKELLQALTK